MRVLKKFSVGFLILGFLATPALADQVVYTSSLPLAPTNWVGSMSIPKFDMEPCVLDSICFALAGHAEGFARFESMDSDPATVTMTLQATITLMRPDMTPLVTVIPLVSTVDDVTAFDGVIDFGGTSGRSYDGLSGDNMETACHSSPEDIALFTGEGNIVLPTDAIGSSYGSGAGNLALWFNTSASAGVDVTYFYHCPTGIEETSWGSIKQLFR